MRNLLRLALITLPIIAIGVGVLIFVVSQSAPPAREEVTERAVPVRAIVTKTQAITPRIIGFGLVTPAREYEAIAQVGGTAEFVNPALDKGALLPAGAVLLRLSQSDFTLAKAQASANIRAAEARLAEMDVSEKNQIASLAIEKEAQAIKQDDLKRTEALVEANTAPTRNLETARAALLAQRQKVLSVESALALMPTQRDVQREQIAVYQTNLETAELNLARTELSLPFDARVASVDVEVGQYVSVGQVIASLDGIDAAEIEAQVQIADLRRIMQGPGEAPVMSVDPATMAEALRAIGLLAVVQLRLGQDTLEWPAEVDRISNAIDPETGTVGVIVRVEDAYAGIAPGERPPLTKGMFVDVVLSGNLQSGVVVPRHAVRDGTVLVADADNRLRLTPVRPDLLQDDFALITQGLAPGTRVVVSALNPVMDGVLLDVTEDQALMDSIAAMGRAE